MTRRMTQEPHHCGAGIYCCGKCSASLWRHLAAGGLARQEPLLTSGVKTLKAHRDGKGRWRRFPYYYTLLALSEMNVPGVVTEMRYAAGGCEKLLKRSAAADKYANRRRALAERVLARC